MGSRKQQRQMSIYQPKLFTKRIAPKIEEFFSGKVAPEYANVISHYHRIYFDS